MKSKLRLFLCNTLLVLSTSFLAINLASCGDSNEVIKVESFTLSLKSNKTSLIVLDKDAIVISNVEPSGAAGGYQFSSSDNSLATIDENGNIVALKKGTVIFTVKDINGAKNTLTIEITEGIENFSLISPAGAPTLAIYDTIANKEGSETTTNVSYIPGFLQNGSYKYTVFDSISALKLTNNSKVAKYTYLTMLTGGNFHLAGFNKTTSPKIGDKIVTFGKDLIPDLAFKTCYSDLFVDTNLTNINYVNSVTDVAPILKSGMYQGNKIDYCFIAQPALFSVMSSNNSDTNSSNDITDIKNLNDKIYEITNGEFNYIPQAALFVQDDYFALKPNYVNEFLLSVKEQMKNARGADLNSVKSAMESFSTNLTDQAAKYGFNENVAYELQKDNKNQFGIMDPTKDVNVYEINRFLDLINAGFNIEYK